MSEPHTRIRSETVSGAVFLVAIVFSLSMAVWLVRSLPQDYPYGGPDEPMHQSMSRYLALHLTWPSWDSPELERYKNGASYATGSSIGYWLEAMTLRLTGRGRLAALLLFTLLLAVLARIFRKNRLAGLVGVAAIVPQALFVFTYVNSDAWSATVAFFLGLAIFRFWRDPKSTINTVLLFAAAGACITCRFHVWAIGGLAFAFAVLPQLKTLLCDRPKAVVWALVLGIILAMWWPVTSYFAHDGDVIGFASNRAALEKFGSSETPSAKFVIGRFPFVTFAGMTTQSLYGRWGWMNVTLGNAWYWVVYLIGIPLFGLLIARRPRLLGLFLLLFSANLLLMFYFSMSYDFQAQGRYLFPTMFLVLAVLLCELATDSDANVFPPMVTPHYRARVVGWLSIFIVLNGIGTVVLANRVIAGDRELPAVARGRLHLQRGDYKKAEHNLLVAVRENPDDAQIFIWMGHLAAKQERFGEAEERFREAIAKQPDGFEARLQLATVLLRQERFAEAVPEFEQVLRINPRSNDAHLGLASIYDQQHAYEKAVHHLEKALEINSLQLQVHSRLNALLRELRSGRSSGR